MNLSSELERLQQLHREGALSDAEFARAKAVALGTDDAPGTVRLDEPPQNHFKTLQMQNEIERLDREWMMERETFMTTDKRGARRLPTRGEALIGMFVGGGFALFWTIMAFTITAGAPFPLVGIFFPLFGVVFLVLVVGSSIKGYNDAGRYEQAEQKYKQQRAQMVARLDQER